MDRADTFGSTLRRKEGTLQRGSERTAIFYGEAQTTADELKGIKCPQGQKNSRSVNLHKTWCQLNGHGRAEGQETEVKSQEEASVFAFYTNFSDYWENLTAKGTKGKTRRTQSFFAVV